jgi:voltage-gated potassium channel
VRQTAASSPEARESATRRERRQKRRDSRIRKAVAHRWAFLYLAAAILILSIVLGILVTIIDHKDFHNVGDGLWWTIVTLGTVGYGDIVPHSALGRVIGAVEIVFGVTFIAFLTANVTSVFISAQQEEREGETDDQRAADLEETKALLRQVLDRVAAVEQKLDRGSADRDNP